MSEPITPHALAEGKTGLLANFARHVDVDGDGCWLWTASVATDGSPKGRDGGKMVYVRRRLYEYAHEEDLDARVAASAACGKDLCVHPEHVEVKSLSDIHRRDVCKRGHDISDPSSRIGGRPDGACKQCVAQRGRESRARAKAAK